LIVKRVTGLGLCDAVSSLSWGACSSLLAVADEPSSITHDTPAASIPASSITADVVGNVVVMTVPRGGGNGRSWTTMTWGAANGTTIKTFP
jgi:hypothetical protein